ncbi:MAG: hypothetical protein LKE46_02310 [Clostridium sp.]|jgi:hypothetical protein|uniref:hypothetical protein n=1 Tax=Clostridium sp. TaxID=1506 RepID=UPI0025C597D4|nr:hypothetical protein [Clostridium sp.]MCH3963083.1 hypothetical protein [Clostridium sp.]MCI1716454.1 hypothetical protein [Clostridium sp.]MCI1800794.1 hypothetical protein [Clostridium sp.]MCI1814551.1 hypothetical protein [Clostridium sp.]MCI1871461.1 hypothetical protein [Clostridium sp.]
MKENILILLTLDEISNITKGLKIAVNSVSQGDTEIDDKLESNIEDVLKKLMHVEAECSR